MAQWIDAHSHLTDQRLEDLDLVLAEARAAGIVRHVQGGIGPEDWARQKEAALLHPEIVPVYGLHPYWVSDHSEAECEQALDELARWVPYCSLIGETGLDFRAHIVKDAMARQLHCFDAQLELARVAKKPVVLHVVRAFDEALRLLDFHRGEVRGLYHSFTGSAVQAAKLIDLGFLISVGGAACSGSARIDQAIQAIPMEHLVIETDSPDQKPNDWPDELNLPGSLIWVARAVGRLKSLPFEEVLDQSRRNLERLLGKRHLHDEK